MTSHLPNGFGSNLANVLGGGAGSNLENILACFESVESVREVGHILAKGACPKLRSLYIDVDEKDASYTCYATELSSWLDRRGVSLTYRV